MMTQRPFNMHVGIYTQTLYDDLRKCLLITLTLLFVCPGVWGQGTQPSSGAGTSESPYIINSADKLDWVFANGGYAQLNQNITRQDTQFEVTANPVHLDLAGYTLTVNPGTYYYSRIIEVTSTGSLTITDSSGTNAGQITGGSLHPGCGAGIYNSGTLVIEGGTITGNNAQLENSTQGYGGAIYNAANASLTISGGVITNNRAQNAGGIYNDGNITLTGGSITNNHNNTTNSLSAGIYNTANATLTLSGNPIVKNNDYGDIFLQSEQKITINGALNGNEGEIGIKMQTPGVFTQDLTTYSTDGWKYFKSDDGNYDPYFDESATNEASLQRNWLVLGKRFKLGGTIKLTKNYTATATTDVCLTVPSETTLTLDLNGHTINRNLSSAKNDGCAIWNKSQLTITDTSGGTEGVITGGKNSYAGGGIDNQGTLTIVKGRITGNSTSTNGGGINNQGTLNIQGGTITGNTATGNGGGIYHNGTAVNSLNIQGAPNITSNTANLEPNNVYLLTGKVITIPEPLTTGVGGANIGVSVQTLGIFTSGLGGDLSNFSSDDTRLTLSLSGSEAKLQSYWGMLQDQMMVNNADITLDRNYEPHPSDVGGLVVPSGNTVTLHMAGHTIDRKLTSAIDEGYVIKNGGTLTITGYGVIKGGYNDGHGGGILNNHSLTLNNNTGGNTNSLDITGNKVTEGHLGAGIYQNGDATLLKMQGYLKINTDNVIKESSDVASNVYLTTGKTITIDGLSASSKIKVTHSDSPFKFTGGFGWDGSGEIFSADNSGYGVGHASDNEAIYGALLTITKNINITTGCSMTVKSNAVQGEVVPISISAGTYNTHSYVPVSLTYTPSGGVEQSISSYPKNGNYSITMPSVDTEIKVVFGEGGYCGASGNEEKMKYYLNSGCLTFVTENNADYNMATYTSSTVPWKDLSYTAVSLSDHVTSISPYAFFGSTISSITIPSSVATIGAMALANCQSLATISVSGGSHFTSDANVLYTNGKTELVCYPAGLDASPYPYTLPNTVTTVRDGAFAYNNHLTAINVESGGIPSFSAPNGVLYNAGGTELYCYPAKKTGDVYDVAPMVTIIKPYAFHNNNLLKVVNFCEDAVPTGGEEMFGGTIHNDLRILVKNGLKVGNDASHYQGADYWKDYYTRIYEMNLANASVSLEYTTHKYEDTYVKPGVNSVKITVGGQEITLRKDIDYVTISDDSYTNNNAVGTATVTVTGKNGYNGTSKATNFTITRELIISGADNCYTYCASENLTLPSGITAWTYTGINWTTGEMTRSQIGFIPANKPVILYKSSGSINGTYNLTAHASESTTVPCVYFKGVSTDTDIATLKSQNGDAEYIYVLRGENFVRATSGTLPAKHCYFYKPSGTAAPSVLTTTFSALSGGSYKIETLNASNGTVTIQYDNSGTPTNVTVNDTEIPAGKTVTLTITPNDGFYLSALQCEEVATLDVAMAPARRADKTQEIHEININTNYEGHFAGDYTFPMPRNNVIVTATFAACTSISSFDLTLDGDNTTKTYDRNPHTVTLKNGETTLVKGTEYGITTGNETYTNVSSNEVTLTGWGRYNGTKSATLSITAKTLTIITDDGQSKVYGASDPVFTYTYSGLCSGDQITGALGRAAGENVGSYAINIGALTAGSNYNIAFTPKDFVINAKDLSAIATVTFTKDYHNYDGNAHQPSIDNSEESNMKVYYGDTRLTLGTNFTTSYTTTPGIYTNATDYTTPDIYTIDITFTGNYTGSKQANYQIRPEITLNNNNGHRWRTYYNQTYNMEVTNDFEAFTVDHITTNSVILAGPKEVIKRATPMLLYRKTGTASGIYPALIKPSDARLADANWAVASTYLKCHVDGGGTPTNWDLGSSGTTIMILVDDKFAYSKSGTLAAGKCYLDVSPISPSPAPSLFIGTNPTGIEEETIKDIDLNGVWYTLDGRQILGVPAQKGIYIKNGKKIIIK